MHSVNFAGVCRSRVELGRGCTSEMVDVKTGTAQWVNQPCGQFCRPVANPRNSY